MVNATTQYYYQAAGSYTAGTTGLTTNVLTSLISALSGSSATSSLVKGSSGNIQTTLNGNTPFANITDPGQAGTASTSAPQAFLTIMFFDERFNYVSTSSQWVQVSQSGDGASPLVLPNVQAPKNGYAYVYISNKGAQPVYFDNMQVALTHGPIMEEDHYYAYGLKIAAISSTIIASPQEGYVANKNLYNDKELEDDGGLNWYDYGYRSYDAQIGRFPQLDPLTDDYPELTPFQYASDEPIANVDEDGLEALNVSMPAEDAFQTGAKVTFGGGLATGGLIRSAAVAGASVATKAFDHAFADEVIEKALEGGAKNIGRWLPQIGKGLGWGLSRFLGVVVGVLSPLDAGQRIDRSKIPKGYAVYGDLLEPIRKYDIKDIPKEKPLPEPDKPVKKPGDDDDDDDSGYLYRFDERSPAEIMKAGGFKAYGTNYNIYEHVTGKSIKNKTSAYVSTSKTKKGALDIWKGRKNGYLYKIKYQLTGVDVSGISPFPHQDEVAVPLFIPASEIVGDQFLPKSQ